jgi:DNA repair exonuclease SbcCD ATPase subunit
MNSEIKNFRKLLERKKGKKETLHKQIKDTKTNIRFLNRDIDESEKAKSIIIHVAEQTQKQLEYHISNITSMAMSSIFPNPYDIILEFSQKRGTTCADIFFERDDNKIKPIDSSLALNVGGGAADVAAFGLQVAIKSLEVKKTRDVLIMDEPLPWLKGGELPHKGAKMIKEISEKLGIQIIMVSHSDALIDSADKVFRVNMKNGKSTIT